MIAQIVITLELVSATLTLHAGAEAADSVIAAVADSARIELEGVTVSAEAPRRLLRQAAGGAVGIDGRMLAEQVSFLGGDDPLAVVRSLPAVSTSNDLQASHSVRGGGTGENLFESDGARVVNPLHMLGLFSAFNPAYYRNYTFSANRTPATVQALTSAHFTAESGMVPDSCLSGSATVGIIESHGALRVPLWHGASVAIGARRTYLDLLFPRLLTLGTSRLKYGFTDLNASVVARAGESDTLQLSAFGNRDRMTISNNNRGNKDGELGWNNAAVSARWRRRNLEVSLAYSAYAGGFRFVEAGRVLDLPTCFSQTLAGARWRVGSLVVGGDVAYRRSSGQNGFGRAESVEGNLAADFSRPILWPGLRFGVGLRVAVYGCDGTVMVRPMPSIHVDYDVTAGLTVFAAARRRLRFDRLVEETTAGLPADFRVCADGELPPDDVYSAEIGVSGTIPATGIDFSVEAYWRHSRHAAEFGGSLLDLASAEYNPLDDLYFGSGNAAGISLLLMRQIGRLRGQISYNYGVARTRIGRFGPHAFPSAHDRPHDLNLRLNWTAVRGLVVSASFTYASGLPCTKPKYGYMIGENLICEYFPHNSSRLPDYKRLDLSVSYTFGRKPRHRVNLSVYNASASRNRLFSYYSYTPETGIELRKSVMNAVIPSVAYTVEF